MCQAAELSGLLNRLDSCWKTQTAHDIKISTNNISVHYYLSHNMPTLLTFKGSHFARNVFTLVVPQN